MARPPRDQYFKNFALIHASGNPDVKMGVQVDKENGKIILRFENGAFFPITIGQEHRLHGFIERSLREEDDEEEKSTVEDESNGDRDTQDEKGNESNADADLKANSEHDRREEGSALS